MSKKRKTLLAAGIIVLLSVAGWLTYAATPIGAIQDDERPPIVVYEGSIQFNYGNGWRPDPQGGPTWKPDLGNDPKPVALKGFEAIAIAGNTVCVQSAARLTIGYQDGSQTHQYTLSIANGDPVLTPPKGVQMARVRHWNLKAGTTGGAITSLADGTGTGTRKPCSFAPSANVRIIVKMN